jgi:hypothetical protein
LQQNLEKHQHKAEIAVQQSAATSKQVLHQLQHNEQQLEKTLDVLLNPVKKNKNILYQLKKRKKKKKRTRLAWHL